MGDMIRDILAVANAFAQFKLGQKQLSDYEEKRRQEALQAVWERQQQERNLALQERRVGLESERLDLSRQQAEEDTLIGRTKLKMEHEANIGKLTDAAAERAQQEAEVRRGLVGNYARVLSGVLGQYAKPGDLASVQAAQDILSEYPSVQDAGQLPLDRLFAITQKLGTKLPPGWKSDPKGMWTYDATQAQKATQATTLQKRYGVAVGLAQSYGSLLPPEDQAAIEAVLIPEGVVADDTTYGTAVGKIEGILARAGLGTARVTGFEADPEKIRALQIRSDYLQGGPQARNALAQASGVVRGIIGQRADLQKKDEAQYILANLPDPETLAGMSPTAANAMVGRISAFVATLYPDLFRMDDGKLTISWGNAAKYRLTQEQVKALANLQAYRMGQLSVAQAGVSIRQQAADTAARLAAVAEAREKRAQTGGGVSERDKAINKAMYQVSQAYKEAQGNPYTDPAQLTPEAMMRIGRPALGVYANDPATVKELDDLIRGAMPAAGSSGSGLMPGPTGPR